MKIGIVGAQSAGKSTVFQALTGLPPIVGQPEAKNRARLGQIKVADVRLDLLESLYGSKKKIPVELTLLDFAANPKEQKPGSSLDPTLPGLIRDLDALLLVVGQFADPGPAGRAFQSLDDELIFADFDQAERRLERVRKDRSASDFERTTLEKLLKSLEAGSPLRLREMTAQEERIFSSFGFLSRKPAFVVINCDIDSASSDPDPADRELATTRGLELFKLAASFESELAELTSDEQRDLLAEAGLAAPARDRLVTALYRRLGLITFYTAGEPEAHAWPLTAGATALEAADRIHSDIARGFIRAEVVGFEDFAALRSDAKVKEAGKLRLEGRDYVMRDGDIIHIRFKA
ncbi:MAG: redox-regulated ATPase YchF [Candidatus Binataceae bacterium]|nr:redox-regulated ATPase YchF [Candidatus Binataceae bacterium]